MRKTKSKQPVDCVALKRQAQAKIYADTKDMSVGEQIEYFRRRAELGKLGAWWKKVSSLTDAPLAVREKLTKYGK